MPGYPYRALTVEQARLIGASRLADGPCEVLGSRSGWRFADCYCLFLAADGMQPRLVFNALVHEYLIPGVQMGAKIVPVRSHRDSLPAQTPSRLAQL